MSYEYSQKDIIKVRKPRVIKNFGIASLYERYSNRQYKFMQALPNNGDRIIITWLPDNRGRWGTAPPVTNAYIGWVGVVEDMDKTDGSFLINSGNAKLICHGNFDYVKLNELL